MAAALEVLINGQDNASGVISGVDSKLGGLGGKAGLAASALGGLAGGALGAGLGALGQRTQELDQNMAGLAARAGLTSEQTDKVKGSIVDLSRSSLQSQTEIAGVAEGLISLQGVSADNAEELQGLTQKYLDFSLATGTDAAGAVEAFDDVMDAWGMTAEDTGGLMDALVLSHQQFGTSVEGAEGALNKMAPTFQTLGLSANDALAYINMFAASGIDAESSSAAFTKAMDALTDSTDAGAQKLQGIADKLGISGDELANLKAQGPDVLFATLTERMGQMEDPAMRAQAAIELFGTKAGPKLAEALAQSGGDLTQFEIDIGEASGATEEAAAKIEGTLTNKLKLLGNEVMGRAQELTQSFAPALMLFGTLGPGVMGAIGGITGMFAPMATAAVQAAGSMSVALLTPPVGVFVLIAAGVAALALVMGTNMFGIRDAVVGVFGEIQTKATEIWGAIKGFLEGNWQEILTTALAILAGPAGLVYLFTTNSFGIRDAVVGAFTDLRDKALGAIKGSASSLFEMLAGHWTEILSVALTFLTGPGGLVFAFTTNAFGIRDAVTGAIGQIPGILLGLVGSFLGAGAALGQGILDGLVQAVSRSTAFAGNFAAGLGAAIKGWINTNIIDKINEAIPNSINVPGPLPDIDLPDNPLPRLAFGMFSVPGVRGSGDNFGALLSPGEMVLSAGAADSLRNSGSGGSVTFQFNGPVSFMGTRDEADRFLDWIADGLLRRGRTFGRA